MMKKAMTTAVMAIAICVAGIAQNAVLPLTGQAARKYQEKDYVAAKELIEQSVQGEGAEDAYTWQVKGHIYKELYKENEKFDMDSKSRETAVSSFFKCIEFDKENKYLEWNGTSLRFLASTYWNDAVSIMEKQDRAQMAKAEEFFMIYIDIMRRARPDENTDGFSLDFYRAYATANRKIIERLRNADAPPEEYAVELKRVEESYQKALKIKSDDYGSNYNYAINIYNEAAYRIGKIPDEAPLDVLMLEQAGCIDLFRRALPIANLAQDLRPGRMEILKALRAIHLSLSNYEDFDRYNKMVREKQGELIIDEKTKYELNRKFFNEEKLDNN